MKLFESAKLKTRTGKDQNFLLGNRSEEKPAEPTLKNTLTNKRREDGTAKELSFSARDKENKKRKIVQCYQTR